MRLAAKVRKGIRMPPKFQQEQGNLPTATIAKKSNHWYTARFPYNADLIDEIRAMPGLAWNKAHRCYRFPADYLAPFTKLLAIFFKVTIEEDKAPRIPANPKIGGSLFLHPYQQAGVEEIINKRTFLLNYEMGLGKTPTALIAAKEAKAFPLLIICPALVRLNWMDEINKWWPDHPEIGMANTGSQAAKAKAQNKKIIITSYELAKHFVNDRFGFIILDEVHYIKNKRAQRSKVVSQIRNNSKNGYIVGLTGTPITSEPTDLWNQLDTLRPNAFGTYWKFVQRYSNNIPNEYSAWIFQGLNEEYAPELATRLACLSSRVTKSEVAHLLPPFSVLPLKILLTKGKLKGIKTNRKDLNAINEELTRAGNHKVTQAVEAVINAYEQGSPTACLTWHRNLAQKIERALTSKKLPTTYIDGDIPVGKRVQQIEIAKANGSILVGTIASMNVGIDLTHFTTAIIAELYSQTSSIIQALGRFSRLSGKLPSTCYVLIAKGTYDEVIASMLTRRLEEQSQLWEAGASEKAALGVLKGTEKTDETFYEELRAVAAELKEFEL